MDDFDNPQNNEEFDSLAAALSALNFLLRENIHEFQVQLEDELLAAAPSATWVSRLAGHWITVKYACDTFEGMEDRFTPAGAKIAALHDDSSYLPELMDEVLFQMKFIHASGDLLKSSMVLLPAQMQSLFPDVAAPLKVIIPPLDRDAVAKGNAQALKWLETDMFPLLKGLCPPRRDQPPAPPSPSGNLPEPPL